MTTAVFSQQDVCYYNGPDYDTVYLKNKYIIENEYNYKEIKTDNGSVVQSVSSDLRYFGGLNQPIIYDEQTKVDWVKKIELNQVKYKIEKIKSLNIGWADDSALPNDEVIENTRNFIDLLSKNNLFPNRINPSIEEGVCLSFFNDNQILYFELYNDGGLGYIIEDTINNKILENEDVMSLETMVNIIKKFYSNEISERA